MPRRQNPSRVAGLAYNLVFGAALLGLWWGTTTAGLVAPFFLPDPAAVGAEAIKLSTSPAFWRDIGTSLFRIAAGFLLAAAIALPMGVWIARSAFASKLLVPPISFIRFVPMPAVIPLMILWFGSGEWGKVMVITLGVFFQLVLMIVAAVAAVPENYVDIARTMEASTYQRFRHFLLPAAAPEIWDSLRINFGLAWATLIFAEILGATSGLGYMIVRAQRFLLVAQVFVAVIVIGILGVLADLLFARFYKSAFPWSEQVKREQRLA
ncbi:MAG TPA: ABC transporter permease [Beijerinckiaceae bacterium]|jgi:NitT/TauT family transport system permease protein